MKINTFEDIKVWQKSRELVKILYKLSTDGNFGKDFGLANQIQRAGVSIMSNIAEGFERQTNKELKQFLYIAKGSCGEVICQLYVALDIGYIDNKQFKETYDLSIIISKMLSNFIKTL